MLTCSNCKKHKSKEFFYRDRSSSRGYRYDCKECFKIKLDAIRSTPEGYSRYITTRRKWADRNREKLRQQDAEWRRANRDKRRITEAKRRARKLSLPDTLTEQDVKDIASTFNNSCSICLGPFEHLDHFIPLSTNRGGTTKENIAPMCSTCNISKRDRNPFIWARTLPKNERENFFNLVSYLSEVNGIAVEEYKAHVYQCFK